MKDILKKIGLLFLLLILNLGISLAQNQMKVTHYMIYQPFINPAAISTYDNFTVAGLYRNQWVGIKGSPELGTIALNGRLGKSNLYLGGIIQRESIGDNAYNRIDLDFSYKARLNKRLNLAFGLKGGINYFQSDFSDSYFNDANDPDFFGTQRTGVIPNFGFGTMLFSEKFYVGFSIPAFLRNTPSSVNYAFDKESHFFMNAGYKFELTDKFDLNTSTLFKVSSGSPLNIDINAQVLYNKTIGLGLNYRTSNEVSGILSWYFNEKFMLSYAYDFTFSRLSKASTGSHEILLIYSFVKKDDLHIVTPRF